MPYFFVDDRFSDSKEVMSIPARHRLAAVGLWTLCGSWSANKLTNGEVPNEVLKQLLPKRSTVVDVLIESTLWERTETGIRFTNWAKWQRTREQVISYRQWDAERKREQRKREPNGSQTGAKREPNGPHLGEVADDNWEPNGPSRNVKTGTDVETSRRDTHRDRTPRPGGIPTTPIPIPIPKGTKEPPYPPPDEPAPPAPPRRKTGAEIALARFTEIPAGGSPIARQAAGAYNRSLPVPLEAKLLNDVTAEIDRCLRSGIPPTAIAAGIEAWTQSDSWSPSQIPKFVHKAANTGRPRNGKATAKALSYDAAANQLINELEKE